MNRYLLSAIFLIAGALLYAQPPAPDFTVTDSDGQVHHLYSDYLNAGKTVVLKIFFTTCPPCNAIAPFMEPFYQEWGGGQADVEFISLSNKNFDSNADVAVYKANHGHTFPGAGSDGGSLQALTPYMDGTYGFFLGTPTFVVIAPNASVNYDPRGSGFAATLDSLDAAIVATGAVKPPVSFSINGLVMTPDSSGVTGAEILINEVDMMPAITDEQGNFTFTALLYADSTYQLLAAKDTNYVNGLTIRDVIAVQKHILNLDTLNTYQLLAADTDHSGNITAQDIVQMQKVILSVESDFASHTSWFFLDASYEFNDPADPFPEAYGGNATQLQFSPSQNVNFSILGIKIGDLNGTAE